MSRWQQITEQPLILILIPLGAVVVAVLWRRNCFGPGALKQAPQRDVGFEPMDLLVGLGLWLLAQSVAGTVMLRFGIIGGDAEKPADMIQAAGIILGQLIGHLPPLAYLAWKAVGQPDGLHRVGLLTRLPGRDLAVGGLGLLVALVLVLSTMVLMVILGIAIGDPAPELGHDMLKMFTESRSPMVFLLLCLATLVLAPLLEECLYRGLVQTALLGVLGSSQRWLVVLIAAGIFAAIHVGAVTWHALPGLLVLGVILGYLYERTGSLWPGIVVHAGFNGFNVGNAMLFYDAGAA
jgi:membrane protease YdiL (CAAX protease family)